MTRRSSETVVPAQQASHCCAVQEMCRKMRRMWRQLRWTWGNVKYEEENVKAWTWGNVKYDKESVKAWTWGNVKYNEENVKAWTWASCLCAVYHAYRIAMHMTALITLHNTWLTATYERQGMAHFVLCQHLTSLTIQGSYTAVIH